MYEKLPTELKQNGKFCLWKYAERNGKKTKIPFKVDGSLAKSNSITDFTDFETACKLSVGYSGIGLGIFNGYSAVDIDNCIANGELSPMAKEIVDTLKSYTEISPSGNGIRILFKTDNFEFDKTLYYIHNAKIGLEIYVFGATNKYVTVTGNAINGYGIENCNETLPAILNRYMLREIPVTKNISVSKQKSYLSDESVIKKATLSLGDKFTNLWNGVLPDGKSQSEANMALASYLAFWCSGDIEQMDRLFRKSGLMRDKWNRKQSGSTYGDITLNKAITMSAAFYMPCNNAQECSDILKVFQPECNSRYSWSDNGNGRLFADVYKDIARYVPERKLWFCFNGERWCADVGNLKVMELCKELADNLMVYALNIKSENKRVEYLQHCKKWQTRRNRETLLKDAQSVYPVHTNEFDRNPYLFNCKNGTLDLETAKFDSHNPKDLLTKIADVIYDPNAKDTRFDKFISEIMSNDNEKAIFLQKILGYALSGDTRYECMFILYGATTRNGKGTLMESMLKLMGDYGKCVRAETIASKQNSNSQNPSEDVARLAGLRFANISEPSKGLVLNSAQVKSMTGNDTVNARFLHENSFDFKPQFKLYINTNYLPVITDTTLFSSNRIFIIPFERHFEDNEQDKTLKTKFIETKTQSAILNWLTEGYKLLKHEGLKPPSSVTIATNQYCHDSDKMALFIEDCLNESCNDEVRTSSVYAEYRKWCDENGMYPESTRVFNQSLKAIAEIRRKRPQCGGDKTTMLIGYTIKNEIKPL